MAFGKKSYVHILIPLLVVVMAGSASAKGPLRTFEGIVSSVADGDTIFVSDPVGTEIKIRLFGIDAPEREKNRRATGRVSKPGQPYGEQAFQALKGKVAGQRVKVELKLIDQHQRAIVWINTRDINREMLREGYAWAHRQFLQDPGSPYLVDEDLARKERRGLWQQPNPRAPWEFRKQQSELYLLKLW